MKTKIMLTVLLITTASLDVMATTIPPDEILIRCRQGLEAFAVAGISRDPYEGRLQQIKEYFRVIGRLEPIDSVILKGPATSTLKINDKNLRGLLVETRDINWQPKMGTKTAVEFEGKNETAVIEQMVTGAQYFNDHEIEAVQTVIAKSFSTYSVESFQHSGVFIIQGESGINVTEPFQARGKNDINFRLVNKNLNSSLKKFKRDFGRKVLKISFIHTHEGEGNPLSADDLKFLKDLVKKYPGIHFKIVAVPAVDHGYVAFEMESP